MNSKYLLSIIIPLFNEEEVIPRLRQELSPLLDELKKRNQDYEIILVNDGSADNTDEKLKSCFSAQPNMQIVTHAKNLGIGAALKTGFKHARGAYALTLESDCTCPPISAFALLEALDEHVDIVTASPYHPQGEVRDVHPFRLLLSKSLSRIYRLILPNKLWTYTNFFRVYRTQSCRDINVESSGFLAISEILIKAILMDKKVKEVPTVLERRKDGSSKMKVVPVICDHLKLIYRICTSKLLPNKSVL